MFKTEDLNTICKFIQVISKTVRRLEQKLTKFGGVRGVMVIVVGNGHGDTSSNHARD